MMLIFCKCLIFEVLCDVVIEVVCVLLIESGFSVFILKVVFVCVGCIYVNLLYYFGFVEGLYIVLIMWMVCDIVVIIGVVVLCVWVGDEDLCDVVEMMFDVFGKGGVGVFVSWMILLNNIDVFDLILIVIYDLVEELVGGELFGICLI